MLQNFEKHTSLPNLSSPPLKCESEIQQLRKFFDELEVIDSEFNRATELDSKISSLINESEIGNNQLVSVLIETEEIKAMNNEYEKSVKLKLINFKLFLF